MKTLIAVAFLPLLTAGGTFAQPFSFELLQSDLVPTVFGSVSWADADRDGKMDVVLTGSTSHEEPFSPTATLYLQRALTGSGPTEQQGFEARRLPVSLWHSASAWSDFDLDGDPDLALLGAVNSTEPYQGRTVLLRNDGNGNLSLVDTDLPALYAGSVDWGDYDNDGDADLLLSGVSDEGFVTALMRNDGGSFSRVNAGLMSVGYGCAQFGDYDGDRDLDVVVSGQHADGYRTEIYRNDGGAFVPIGLDPSLGLVYSAAAWGDVDDDGDLDLLLAGGVLSEWLYSGRSFVLINAGSDQFHAQILDDEGFLGGSVAWGDVDLDGDLDALVTGSYFPAGPRAARVYFNKDTGLEAGINLPGTLLGDAAFGDYDRDGDLDLVMTGIAAKLTDITNLYVNTQRLINDPPDAPTQVQASVEGGRATLTWAQPSDDRPGRLTYNLRIGTSEEDVDKISPVADPKTGRRYLEGTGNVQQNTGWVIENLPPGTYWWSVQAIDGSFAGSRFSTTQSFTVPGE